MERRQSQALFDKWMRSGRLPDPSPLAERKFNPYHDPDDGRFTFGPGNAGTLRPRPMSMQSRSAGQVRQVTPPSSPKVPSDPIGDIIERELRRSSAAHGTAASDAQARVKHARSVLTHWPIAGGSEAMLNRADKLHEGGPRYGDRRGKGAHKGIDLKAPAGTPVRSAGPGAIVAISPNPSPSYGVQVVIYHGNGVYTHYAHLQPGSPTLRPGTKVKAGDVIGRVGRTGNTPSSGDTHLHFEVRIGSPRPVTAGGKTSDPLKLLPRGRP